MHVTDCECQITCLVAVSIVDIWWQGQFGQESQWPQGVVARAMVTFNSCSFWYWLIRCMAGPPLTDSCQATQHNRFHAGKTQHFFTRTFFFCHFIMYHMSALGTKWRLAMRSMEKWAVGSIVFLAKFFFNWRKGNQKSNNVANFELIAAASFLELFRTRDKRKSLLRRVRVCFNKKKRLQKSQVRNKVYANLVQAKKKNFEVRGRKNESLREESSGLHHQQQQQTAV